MKTCLILCGGKNDEHEISLLSTKCVLDALDRSRFTPVVVGISRQGIWYLEEEKTFYLGEFRADQIRLNEDTDPVTVTPYLTREGRGRLIAGGRIIDFDVVFPLMHGQFAEDGTIQGFWETVGVPYVGANTASSALCMDKWLTKQLCQKNGVNVTDFVSVRSAQEIKPNESAIAKLGYPLFVKSNSQGSSVGVTKVKERSELEKAVQFSLKFDSRCLIEKGIVGREIECSVLGLNANPKASLPGEIIPAPSIGWYSYDAKYILADGAETVAPAVLDAKTTREVQDFVIKVFKTLQCDGMARIDLFIEKQTGTLYLNEANTIPGFSPISMYPKMWQASGLSYTDLISELIRLAFLRVGRIAE